MIAAALIGGLAAAALVHTSLTIAVIVSVVAGGIAVLAVFRSPARPPELMAGEAEDEDSGRYPAARRRQAPPAAQVPTAAPDPVAPIPAASDGQARGGPPANEAVVQLLPLPPQPGNAEPGRRALVGLGSDGAAAAESGGQAVARSGPVHLPGVHLYRAVPALRRVPVRLPAGQERLGLPL